MATSGPGRLVTGPADSGHADVIAPEAAADTLPTARVTPATATATVTEPSAAKANKPRPGISERTSRHLRYILTLRTCEPGTTEPNTDTRLAQPDAR
jgi:hypothetical protein